MEDKHIIYFTVIVIIIWFLPLGYLLYDGLTDDNEQNQIDVDVICDEHGYCENVEYDAITKTIKCEPATIKEKYDGDYIQITYKGD